MWRAMLQHRKCLLAIILLAFASFTTGETDQSSTEIIAAEIRQAFEQHASYVSDPLGLDELLCKCSERGCDREIVDIAGANYSGICRAHKGGMCRKTIQLDIEGHVKDAALACVSEHELVPPERPFVCQSVFGSKYTHKVECCKTNLCNYIEITIEEPEASTGLHWYILLLLIVAVFFSAMGLLVGIFWCSSDRSKRFIRNFLSRLFGRGGESFGPERGEYTLTALSANGDSRLERLLDDLEVTMSTGSGAGMPILAQRTISRQIELRECIGRGRFGESSWQRETEVYRTNMLRHSNLLRWIASDNKDTGTCTQLWLITEYWPLGSVCDYLEKYEMNPVLAMQFIRSIVHGLTYLHTEIPGVNTHCFKPGIAHRDIKTRNILVKNDMTCAIADLGMAVRCVNGVIDLPEHTRGGTARYLAPEFLLDTFVANCFNSYLQMDVYAFALVMWEIARRVKLPDVPGLDTMPKPYEVPYYEYVPREPEIEEMRECVCDRQHRPTIPPEWRNFPIMEELTRIMCESWSPNPNSRLTALNIRYSLDALIKKDGIQIIT
ncbi:protein tyrosine kinase domain-containing protein [Ditylenchus destructor]|nr:protein tyrosine kinase domain-containing protein [Ditylenchus destructor]